MTDHRQNLELKVRCTDEQLARITARLESLVCAPIQPLHQVDTYFRVDQGRLKLRELRDPANPSTLQRAELIAYARPTDAGTRLSTYEVVPVAAAEVLVLLRALGLTHSQLVRVEKRRNVGIIGRTRVHLDRVTGLGSFVELETVLEGQAPEAAEVEHRQVIAALDLGPLDSIAGSYSDLLLADRTGG